MQRVSAIQSLVPDAQIDSLAGIASPPLLASFALLGIVPWIAKGIIGLIKRA